MDKDGIIQEVYSIIKRILECREDYRELKVDEPLTGSYYRMNATDMVYLFLEVRKKFHISLLFSDVADMRFNTISDISDIVYRKLQD